MHDITRGWSGLLIVYLLVCLGLQLAVRYKRPEKIGVLWAALMGIPVLVAVIVIGAFLLDPITRNAGVFAYVLSPIYFVASSALIGVVLIERKSTATHMRGAVLRGSKGGRLRHRKTTDELTIAGYPVAAADETKHFKLIGTTGTGKSTAITELLTGAISRGDRAIFADPDGSYLKRFYDAKRGDKILNPFDKRASSWNLFQEIYQLHDTDQLALALIPDHSGPDGNWRRYARTFLTALLRQLHRIEEHDIGRLYQLLVTAPVDDLRELLDGTAAAPYLLQENGKFFASVRAVATTYLTSLEHVALQQSAEQLSVRNWIREGKGLLFCPYTSNEIASLKNLISAWMRLAIFETMHTDEKDHRLWFVVDELDALGAIDGLKDALARLRKFGGRCVLGFQSIGQVRGNYGETEAQSVTENCGNTLILRCSASEHGGTSKFASTLIGSRQIVRVEESRSGKLGSLLPWDSRSKTERHVTEDAVMASEIEQLPDLAGFLKLASAPEWTRVSMASHEAQHNRTGNLLLRISSWLRNARASGS